MADSFKARDGSEIADGDSGTYELAYDTASVLVTGTIRKFDHVERVYDDEGIAVGKTSEPRWEILTDDPMWTAVGIKPENVIRVT